MTDANPLVDDTVRRMVQMLANGHRQQDICDELHISRSVIWHRLTRTSAQVGAKNSTHLVAIALRRHWIS